MTPERAERICVKCIRPIVAPQLFTASKRGPCHAFCQPPARLDVERVERAARGR